jgi:hypothetical protein
MGSHIASIGLVGQAFEAMDFEEAMRLLLAHSLLVGKIAIRQLAVYAYDDPSGSRATITTERDTVSCFTPSFRPGSVLRIQPGSLAEDDCPFERPFLVDLHDDDGPVYPLAIQIEDLALSDERHVGDSLLRVEVAALAEVIELFADEATYRASGTSMATESLIPSGTFVPPGTPGEEDFRPSPRILMSGVVQSAELRRHFLVGGEFVRMTVSSYGARYEVLAASADLADETGQVRVPSPGSIVSGQFWLSGRVLGPS